MEKGNKPNICQEPASNAIMTRINSLKSYLANKGGKQLKPTTLNIYEKVLYNFGEFLDSNVHHLDELTTANVERFLTQYYPLPRRRNQAVPALKAMLEFIDDADDEAIPNIDKIIRRVKPASLGKKKRMPVLSPSQLDDMRVSIRYQSEYRADWTRNLLMYDLFCETWIRNAELVAIRLGDIDSDNGIIYIRGKGANINGAGEAEHTRTVKVSQKWLNDLDDYLINWRIKLGIECPTIKALNHYGHLPLFTSTRRRQISVRTVNLIMSQAARSVRSDTVGNYGPHLLRRSLATLEYKKTKDIIAIQYKLGHSDMQTTRLYIQADALDHS